jgi:hypothetical protein
MYIGRIRFFGVPSVLFLWTADLFSYGRVVEPTTIPEPSIMYVNDAKPLSVTNFTIWNFFFFSETRIILYSMRHEAMNLNKASFSLTPYQAYEVSYLDM